MPSEIALSTSPWARGGAWTSRGLMAREPDVVPSPERLKRIAPWRYGVGEHRSWGPRPSLRARTALRDEREGRHVGPNHPSAGREPALGSYGRIDPAAPAFPQPRPSDREDAAAQWRS